MSGLKELLFEFERTLKQINSPLLKKLNAGIRLEPQNHKTPFLSGDVNILYEWKNGTKIEKSDILGSLWLFNFGVFISFEKAIDLYSQAVGKVSHWDEYKFPLFISGAGEFFLLECNPKSDQFGMIYFHSIGDIEFDEIITKYDSRHSFIKTINECYLKRIYSYSNNGIHFDVELEREVSKLLNPRSAFWNSY